MIFPAPRSIIVSRPNLNNDIFEVTSQIPGLRAPGYWECLMFKPRRLHRNDASSLLLFNVGPEHFLNDQRVKRKNLQVQVGKAAVI